MNPPADFPGKGHWLARARLGQGRVQEAIQILEDGSHPGTAADAFLGYAYGRAGRRADAARLVAETSDPYSQDLALAGMVDKEGTLAALERLALLVGPVRLGRDLTYPEFDLVRADPRIKALRARVGLP